MPKATEREKQSIKDGCQSLTVQHVMTAKNHIVCVQLHGEDRS